MIRLRAAGWGGIAAIALGCQPRAYTDGPVECPVEAPAIGEVVASALWCNDMRVPGGEGRVADFYLANSVFSAVIRHPVDALTLAGVGGGTVVDAAPWGHRDRLHEVAPLVDGGWLLVDDWQVEPDGFRIGGTVVSLPDRPADRVGERREVRWRIRPDVPWLELEGADGLWLHPIGGVDVFGDRIVAGDVVYGHDGALDDDLGGAMRIDGATRLIVAPLADAWGWLADEPVEVGGQAPGADTILLWRGDEVVGRLPVDGEGGFAATVDASVDGLQARGGGRAPSPIVPAGADVQLELGDPGFVTLRPTWTSRPRSLLVTWRADDGRGGRSVLGPDGGTLAIGAGAHDLTISAGPASQPRDIRVEIAPEQTVEVGIPVLPRFDPGPRVLVGVGWAADRARTWRGSDLGAALLASGLGYDYVVFTAEDEVAGVDDRSGSFPRLIARNGTELLHRGGDFGILSWSFAANDRRNAHGAPDISGRGPVEALALAEGGPGRGRLTAVDLGWLDLVTAPHLADPVPDFVHLSHPGVDGEAWTSWFRWLDSGALLSPLGPYTWARVDDPGVLGAADVERALIPGAVSVGTGALLRFSVEGVGPGGLVGPTEEPPLVAIRVDGDDSLDRVALIGEGGQVLLSWTTTPTPVRKRLPSRWVVAVAWSTTTSAWAATGPVWTGRP